MRSYFLQIIKAQIQSPHPSLMLFDCIDKPQCASLYVFDVLCKRMCDRVRACIVRCQQAPQACTVCPFQNPSNAVIPFKAVSGVTELSLEVELLLVLI